MAAGMKMPSAKVKLGAAKAKKILSDGTVRGNPLTPGQKGLFGAIAGGAPTAGSSAGAKRTKGPAKPMPIGMRAALGPRTRNAIKRGM